MESNPSRLFLEGKEAFAFSFQTLNFYFLCTLSCVLWCPSSRHSPSARSLSQLPPRTRGRRMGSLAGGLQEARGNEVRCLASARPPVRLRHGALHSPRRFSLGTSFPAPAPEHSCVGGCRPMREENCASQIPLGPEHALGPGTPKGFRRICAVVSGIPVAQIPVFGKLSRCWLFPRFTPGPPGPRETFVTLSLPAGALPPTSTSSCE